MPPCCPFQKAEVRSEEAAEAEEGLNLNLFYLSATVVRSLPNQRRYIVSFSSSNLRETVDATHLRPRPPDNPPPPPPPSRFCLYDCVDAFRDGAWWPGVVVGLDLECVRVCFPLRREEVPFPLASFDIRPHLEWLSDTARWVPPHLLQMPPSLFHIGADVQVQQLPFTDIDTDKDLGETKGSREHP